MAKPASHTDWTDGAAAKVVEPSAAKKLLGWTALERPPFEYMNFIHFNDDEWIKYLEGITDLLLPLQSTYDAVIGTGGTHATLNAAIADAGLGANSRILVFDPATLTSTQVLSKDGWFVEFKPSAIYSQGATTSPGIQVTGERVTLVNGRFTDFDGGTDVAIELAAASKNGRVAQCSFLNVDTDIQDDGTNNSLHNNITEV